MPIYERHVFVCGNSRPAGHARGDCQSRGGEEIREALKRACKARGLASRVRVNHAGCLDQCEHGPTLVVYPEQVWYGGVRLEDVADIVESHLMGGVAVERLRIAETCINNLTCPHRAKPTPAGG